MSGRLSINIWFELFMGFVFSEFVLWKYKMILKIWLHYQTNFKEGKNGKSNKII